MKTTYKQNLTKLAIVAGFLTITAGSAYAQSTEETVGAIIGGVAGSVIGGEIDNKGSKTEGKVIGAVIGGSLGYVIGGELERDRELRQRYQERPGEYYTYGGEPYRRYRNDDYGYVSFPVRSGDPYYYRDGRKKDHPVFAEHPGQGKGKGLKKKKYKKYK